MYKLLLSLSVCAITAYAQTAQDTAADTIRCRLCNRASTLSDCNKLILCDATLEECYMDKLFTEQRTVVFQGGCRAKDVCSQAGKKKRGDHVLCSGCCAFERDCNKRLCGIKDDTMHSGQCYSCDHRNSEQSEVRDPKKCVTLDTCQSNEQCVFLMERAYENHKVCVLNSTAPPNGLTWIQACGSGHSRSASLCHSCCGDGGCNYGTCKELNDRIFKLADQGKFDFKTLKATY